MQRLVGNTNSYVIKGKESDFLLKRDGKFGSSLLAYNEQNEKVYLKEIHSKAKNYEIGLSGIAREIKYTPENEYCHKPLDFFKLGNRTFLVRPFFDGESLKNIMEQKILFKTLNKQAKINLAIEISKALVSIHQLNIIHRDIRPSNIILCNIQDFKTNPQTYPIIKIIDFGMAQDINEKIPENLKVPFALIYSPPEQLLNKHQLINYTSDIYAASLTLFELFAGEKPFYNDNPEFLMNLQLNNPIPKNENINEDLYRILLKGSSKIRFPKPPALLNTSEIEKIINEGQQLRFQDASELLSAFNEYKLKPENLQELKKPWYKKWLD